MNLAISCLSNIYPSQFRAISEQYPDLVKHLQQQVSLMGQFGPNGGVPWLSDTDGALCFICKSETEDFNHFAVNCPHFREEFQSLWSNLKNRVISCNPFDGSTMPVLYVILHHMKGFNPCLGACCCHLTS